MEAGESSESESNKPRISSEIECENLADYLSERSQPGIREDKFEKAPYTYSIQPKSATANKATRQMVEKASPHKKRTGEYKVDNKEMQAVTEDFSEALSFKGTRYAFVTLVAEDCCGPFALVVASSLRQLTTSAARIALISDKITDSARVFLEEAFDSIVEVRREFFVKETDEFISDACWEALMKAYGWTLTQFDKCVFLDVDSLVMINIDELFQYEELSAVASSGWPDFFNTGVFVFQPSIVTYQKLVKFILGYKDSEESEETIMNQFFSGWSNPENPSKHLQHLYNVNADCNPKALIKFQDSIRVFRCSGALKSWMDDEDKSLDDLSNTSSISLPATPHQPFLHKWLTLLFENEFAIQWALAEINDSDSEDVLSEDVSEEPEDDDYVKKKECPSNWTGVLEMDKQKPLTTDVSN